MGTLPGLTPLLAGKRCSSSSSGSRERASCSRRTGESRVLRGEILGMGWGIGAFAAGETWDFRVEAAASSVLP